MFIKENFDANENFQARVNPATQMLPISAIAQVSRERWFALRDSFRSWN
jgi:hypothetical protein